MSHTSNLQLPTAAGKSGRGRPSVWKERLALLPTAAGKSGGGRRSVWKERLALLPTAAGKSGGDRRSVWKERLAVLHSGRLGVTSGPVYREVWFIARVIVYQSCVGVDRSVICSFCGEMGELMVA